jgi:hypothetical protein
MRLRQRKLRWLGAALAAWLASPPIVSAQTRPAVLEIDVENLVAYIGDAHHPTGLRLGDITAVNGQPAMGTYSGVAFGWG